MESEFNNYVQLYNADLTRLCVSLCGNISEAEDLLQDTWLKALKYYDKYDKSKAFDKWLYSICVNTYRNSLKSAFMRKRKLFRDEEEELIFFSSIPQVNDKTKEEYFELHKAISALSKKQRIVVVLYYFKDYSVAEISQILNIPQGTVKSRLSSARAEIKRRMNYE